MMGTFLSVAIFSADEKNADKIITSCFEHLEARVNEISDWEPQSACSELSEKRKIANAPSSLRRVLDLSNTIEASSKTFTPFTLELTKLWREARLAETPPHPADIAKLVREMERSRLQIDPAVTLVGKSGLEFGGIGKGLIADLGCEYLASGGVSFARVAGSGDIRFLGNTSWSVDVEHPRDEDRMLATLELSGPVGIATSGDYRSFFMSGGKRYHHLLDPSSGLPASFHQSVTVAASSAALADGLATAAFLMPTANALKWLREARVFRAILVDTAGKIHSI